jgi:hypothetical protein
VVALQVSFAAVVRNPQRFEDHSARRFLEPALFAFDDNRWSPTAIHAAPMVTLKGQDAKPVVRGIVTAFGSGATRYLLLPLMVNAS